MNINVYVLNFRQPFYFCKKIGLKSKVIHITESLSALSVCLYLRNTVLLVPAVIIGLTGRREVGIRGK